MKIVAAIIAACQMTGSTGSAMNRAKNSPCPVDAMRSSEPSTAPIRYRNAQPAMTA